MWSTSVSRSRLAFMQRYSVAYNSVGSCTYNVRSCGLHEYAANVICRFGEYDSNSRFSNAKSLTRLTSFFGLKDVFGNIRSVGLITHSIHYRRSENVVLFLLPLMPVVGLHG